MSLLRSSLLYGTATQCHQTSHLFLSVPTVILTQRSTLNLGLEPLGFSFILENGNIFILFLTLEP